MLYGWNWRVIWLGSFLKQFFLIRYFRADIFLVNFWKGLNSIFYDSTQIFHLKLSFLEVSYFHLKRSLSVSQIFQILQNAQVICQPLNIDWCLRVCLESRNFLKKTIISAKNNSMFFGIRVGPKWFLMIILLVLRPVCENLIAAIWPTKTGGILNFQRAQNIHTSKEQES